MQKYKGRDESVGFSAERAPGRRPKVGPLLCHNISRPIAISHPKDPRSSRALPSDASVSLITLLEGDANSLSRCSSEVHSRCSSSGRCHSAWVSRRSQNESRVAGWIGTVSSGTVAGLGSLDESGLRGAVVKETGTMPSAEERSGRAVKKSR